MRARCLLCQLIVAVAVAVADPRRELETVDPNNTAKLLALGKAFQEQGELVWALRCFRRVVRLGEGPEFPEASYRAAMIDFEQHRYQQAYTRLRELLATHDLPEAREILENGATAATRRQRELMAKGATCFQEGDYDRARDYYTRAYRCIPASQRDLEEDLEEDFIPRRVLLERIARCVDQLDDEYFKRTVQPFTRSIVKCSRCKSTGGFLMCPSCNGSGTKTEVFRPMLGRGRTVRRTVRCKKCNGQGKILCGQCWGFHFVVDDASITRDEKKALLSVFRKIRGEGGTLRKTTSLATALRDVEEVILRVDHSAALGFFRAIKPIYLRSKNIRDAIGGIPAFPSGIEKAAGLWKAADIFRRCTFLSAYAVEFTHHVHAFDMLRNAERVPSEPPPKASAGAGVTIDPEILSAFPEEGKEGWLAVRGILHGYKEGSASEPWGREKGHLDLRGAIGHTINFFVWLPSSEPHLAHLAKVRWGTRVGELSQSYPFDLHEKLTGAPAGHQVVVVGRLLRDRLGYPRNWFEVWDIEIGLTPSQEEMLRLMRELLTYNVRELPVEKLPQILSLCGVDAEFSTDAPVDALIRFTAVDCPLGIFLDDVAQAIGVGWHYENGKVIVGSGGPPERQRDRAEVLSLLRAAPRGADFAIEVGLKRRGSPDTTLPLPHTEEELLQRAREANLAMDYATMAACCRRISELSDDPVRCDLCERLHQKYRLYHELTRRTPVSNLVDGEDLIALKVQLPHGKTYEGTVKVLHRDASTLTVQSSYADTISYDLSRVSVISDRPITTADWRAVKDEHLNELERAEEQAVAHEKSGKLFMLALFCKTNNRPRKTLSTLQRIINQEGFQELIRTYFPLREAELVRLWEGATTRVAQALEPVPPPPPEDTIAHPPDKPTSQEPEELFRYAAACYRQGRSCLSKAIPGMRDSEIWAQRALDRMRRSQQAMLQLTKARPLSEIEERLLHRVVQGIEDSLKLTTLF